MPEGPEIRRAADEIAAAIVGRETVELFFAFDHLKPYEAQLTGQQIIAVKSRGKAMLVRFENGLNIFSHNQLYGKWMVRNAYDYPLTNRQLRLAIHTSKKSALLYSASEIEVLADSVLGTHPFLSKLGPDLLDESTTVEQVVDRLMHKAFYRRRLSTILLDQHFLAGMGNYLRSEVLFVAQLHPLMRPVFCSPRQIRKLAETALNLTRQSCRTGGVTNDLQRAEQLRALGAEFEQYRFWVFRRQAEPCYRCGTLISKEVIDGRRLYFCPECQQL